MEVELTSPGFSFQANPAWYIEDNGGWHRADRDCMSADLSCERDMRKVVVVLGVNGLSRWASCELLNFGSEWRAVLASVVVD